MMSKVIDIRSRIKTRSQGLHSGLLEHQEAPVLDMTEKRTEALKDDRRQVKRTILTEFIAVHTIIPGNGLMKVALFDINERGVSFDIEDHRGHFQVGEEVPMRVYLNHKTYFPFIVQIKNVRLVEDEGVQRHGAEFLLETINDVALHHFIKFIENVSASLRHDSGDVSVSKINS